MFIKKLYVNIRLYFKCKDSVRTEATVVKHSLKYKQTIIQWKFEKLQHIFIDQTKKMGKVWSFNTSIFLTEVYVIIREKVSIFNEKYLAQFSSYNQSL